MALITVDQVQTRLDRTFAAGSETAQVEAFIDDVSAELLEVGDDEWTAETLPDVVVPVAVRAVRRALDNPHGLQSETIGPYTWRDERQTGIYLTAAETKTVRRAAAKLGVGTIDLDSWLPAPTDPNVTVTEDLEL